MQQPLASAELIACPGCDLLHYRRELNHDELARCERCADVIQTRKSDTIDRTLAASLAGIVFLIISLFTPFLSLSRTGIESSITVLDAVQALWNSQMRWLGLLTLAFIALLPLLRLLLLIWVLGRLRFGRKVRSSMRLGFRLVLQLEPWAMADIFLVGVLVSLVKISTLANLTVGLAFWSLLMLVGVSILINLTLCKDTVWTRISTR
ncbi:MAG: paraquat-inducible protein A [Granulosicoccus sp.]|nr:paraquat-inducible protein A [Granulosicoccus sp.]